MIVEFKNLLTDDELEYLQSKCNLFVKNNLTIPDGINHFYNSMHIDSGLNTFKEKVLEIVNKSSPIYKLQHNGIFINKITSETNIDDSYHRDECDLTIVSYLNSNYEGGYFEYIIDNKIYIFKPTVNSSIMMDKKILHRVLPVINGVRYSLVTWFRLINKNII